MTSRGKRASRQMPRFWLTGGWLAWLLLPISLLFRLLVASRRWLFRNGWLKSTAMPVPVIVVGNIFVGGTGKTPLVIWLAQSLARAGLHPGVVSRGYGGRADAPQLVTAASHPQQTGDEPVLIALRAACPVVVGRDRVEAAHRLLQSHPGVDVVISDDGLQHYRLQRQVEIAVFDSRGVGNGLLLPAGPLREPARRARDFTVINGAESAPGVEPPVWQMTLEPANAWQLADPGRRMALAPLCAGRQVLASAGIGNPSRFFSMLAAIGLQFQELPLPDHHAFDTNPFATSSADVILITEKDAVKCADKPALVGDARLWVVPVTASLDGSLIARILEKVRGPAPA